jgi:hypothetical protein
VEGQFLRLEFHLQAAKPGNCLKAELQTLNAENFSWQKIISV